MFRLPYKSPSDVAEMETWSPMKMMQKTTAVVVAQMLIQTVQLHWLLDTQCCAVRISKLPQI